MLKATVDSFAGLRDDKRGRDVVREDAWEQPPFTRVAKQNRFFWGGTLRIDLHAIKQRQLLRSAGYENT
jgi:hypothetical protein